MKDKKRRRRILYVVVTVLVVLTIGTVPLIPGRLERLEFLKNARLQSILIGRPPDSGPLAGEIIEEESYVLDEEPSKVIAIADRELTAKGFTHGRMTPTLEDWKRQDLSITVGEHDSTKPRQSRASSSKTAAFYARVLPEGPLSWYRWFMEPFRRKVLGRLNPFYSTEYGL